MCSASATAVSPPTGWRRGDERVQSVITVGASWHSRQLGPVREMFENLTPAFFRENMARQVAVYEALNPQPDLDTLTADLRRMWLDISASGYPNETHRCR